jgi:hypothetical protein
MPADIADSENPSGHHAPGLFEDFGVKAEWEERVVASVAVTVAVMVVAAIAILMGMV